MIGEVGQIHNDVLGVDMDARYIMDYSGRIWPEEKLLSFWKYPETAEKMKEVASDIEKELENYEYDDDIWNEYEIEIIVPNDDGENDTINDLSVEFSNNSHLPEGYTTEIILLKNYVTSEDVDTVGMSIPHTMSPMQKQNVDVSQGWGSKKRPADLTGWQRHQMKSTSENKK